MILFLHYESNYSFPVSQHLTVIEFLRGRWKDARRVWRSAEWTFIVYI